MCASGLAKAMTWATRSAGRQRVVAKNTFEIFGGGRDIFDGAMNSISSRERRTII